MFWIELLISILDIYMIYGVIDMLQMNIVNVTDLVQSHRMHGKNVVTALFVTMIILFTGFLVIPVSHMLTGAIPLNPVLIGFAILYMLYLYNLNLIDFPR